MLEVKIQVVGKTLADINDAAQEALQRITAENTSGHDRNTDGAFVFTVEGEADPSSDQDAYFPSTPIDRAAICQHSGSRIHVMGQDGSCQYCRKDLILVASDG